MSQLVEVDGRDTSGTTMFIYYKDGTSLRLIGSASNTTAANNAQDGDYSSIATYSSLVLLRDGEVATNIIVYNQAGTIQTIGTDPQTDGDFAVTSSVQ